MKILLDMNMSLAWLAVLRDAGHDCLHWTACGAIDAADLEIMFYAKANGYIVLTHDLDFGTLLSSSSDSAPSVVQLRAANLTPQAVSELVLRTLVLARRDLEQGALITLDANKVRLRILPMVDRDLA